MTSAEHALFVVEGPVVDRADPMADESRTAELPHPGLPVTALCEPGVPDLLVPSHGEGLRGWASRVGGALRRHPVTLALLALAAALPAHFFVGRLDDTLIAAPALSDLAGGFGLLLLPLMWLAYFAAGALPMLILLAGVVGAVLPAAAGARGPRLSTMWSLVAYRLRTVWVWLALGGSFTQTLPLLLDTDSVRPSVAGPLTVLFAVAATAVLTLVGMLGCVVLVEHGRGPRRALHLLTLGPRAGLIGAAAAFAVLPRVTEALVGAVACTAVTVVSGALWAVASLIAYAQARRGEGPVTSRSLAAELAAPELF